MRESDRPGTQTMNASAVRANWSEVLNRIYRTRARVVVEKSGIPVAVLISPDDLARLNRLEVERDARFAVIDQIRDAFRDVPDEELEREIPKAVAEARAQLRAEREQAAKPA